MPEKQEASGLLAALGNQLVDAFNTGKTKPIDLKFGGQLPAGIENGVAELRDLKIGKYADGTPNAGKPYFLGQAVVLTPKEHKGQKCAGLFTRIGPEPLCDTLDKGGDASRKTFQQHFQWMLDHLRQLGWNPAEIRGKSSHEVENILFAAMKALCIRKPPIYFRFRTWQGQKQVIDRDTKGKIYLFSVDDSGNRKCVSGKGPYPSEQIAKVKNPFAGREPLVQHVWGGVIADYHSQAANGVTDDTDSYTPTNRISTMSNGAGSETATDGNASADESNKEQFDEFGGLSDVVADLVNRAWSDDGAAQDDLTSMAVNAGWTEEEVQAAEKNWSAVADMIRSPKSRDESESGAEPQAQSQSPSVEDVVNYHPIDKKSKRPAKKACECEVLAVDKQNHTVNLKSLRDGKTIYEAVPWDQLS